MEIEFRGLLRVAQGAILSKPNGNHGKSMMYSPAPKGIICYGINLILQVCCLKAKLLINSIPQIPNKSTCGHESMQYKRKKR